MVFVNMVWRSFCCLDFSWTLILVHYFDTIMLSRLGEQDIAIILDTLVTYIYTRGPKTLTFFFFFLVIQ